MQVVLELLNICTTETNVLSEMQAVTGNCQRDAQLPIITHCIELLRQVQGEPTALVVGRQQSQASQHRQPLLLLNTHTHTHAVLKHMVRLVSNLQESA